MTSLPTPDIALPRPLDRSRQAAPQVFERLRARILSLDLAPGMLLSRADLQREFGLSQTPIRDALLRLQQERLVEIFPQHATVVAPIDLSLAYQAQFLRRSVEQEVVRVLAEQRDGEVIGWLRASLARQEALAEANDMEGFAAADRAFHRHMHEAARVPDLFDLVAGQSGHLERLRRLHLPLERKAELILGDHRAIVESISGGRPELAQRRLRDHVSRSIANVEDLNTRFPGYLRM